MNGRIHFLALCAAVLIDSWDVASAQQPPPDIRISTSAPQPAAQGQPPVDLRISSPAQQSSPNQGPPPPINFQISTPLAGPQVANQRQSVIAQRDELWKAAHQLEAQQKLDEAAAKVRDMLPLERQLVGNQHEELAAALAYLAELEIDCSQFEAAKTDRAEVLKIKTGLYGADHWRTTEARLAAADADTLMQLSETQRQQWISADLALRNLALLLQQKKAAEALSAVQQAVQAYSQAAGAEHWRTAIALNLQGQLLMAMNRNDDAIPLLKQAADIDAKAFGEHPTTAAVLNKLGDVYLRKIDPAAIPLLQHALKINQETLGPEHPETLTSMNDLGVAFFNNHDFKSAIELHQQALQIRRRLLGNEHPYTLLSLQALAQTHKAAKEYVEAQPLFQELHDARVKTLGAEHPDTVLALSALARTYYELKQYDVALPMYEQLKLLDEKVLGANNQITFFDLMCLAIIYRTQQNFTAAREVFDVLSGRAQRVFRAEDPTTIAIYDGLAGVAKSQGDYKTAEQYFSKNLATHEKISGPESRDTLHDLFRLGNLYVEATNFSTALQTLQRALHIAEKTLPPDDPDLGIALECMSGLYLTTRNAPTALPYMERALKIAEKIHGENDPSLVVSINNMASTYRDLGRLPEALALYQRGLHIVESTGDSENPLVAMFHHRLAQVDLQQGKPEAALAEEHKALALREKIYGDENPDTCLSLNLLGEIYAAQGNYADAREALERTLQARQKMFGPDNTYLALNMKELAVADEALGDGAAALPLAREALRITRISLDNVAATESEIRQYLTEQGNRTALDAFLSAAAATGLEPNQIYAPVLTWKGALSARQRWVRAARSALQSNPEAQHWYDALEAKSRALATAYGAIVPANQQATQKAQIIRLSQEVNALEQHLSQASQEFRAAREATRCTPAELANILPASTALVDFIEYLSLGKPKNDGERYTAEAKIMAFVIRPGHDVEMVDLGPSVRIYQAVQLWRVNSLPFELKSDVETQTSKLNDLWKKTYGTVSPEQKLREWVWEPIDQYLDDDDTVLISPDGALNYFPWAALPGKGSDHYLLEETALATVPVPQLLPEILATPPADAASNPSPGLLLIGDVHTKGDPGTPRQTPQTLSPVQAESRPAYGDLPKSRESIAAIGKTFTSAFPAGYVEQLTGDQPTEQAFRDFAPRATFIHLVVHGFFDPDLRAGGKSSRDNVLPFANQADAAFVHPDLLCGLAFVGADLPPQPGKDDGILTGLELKELNLERVELVTMASCQAALGVRAPGEGVLGIQRAFQVAGARTSIASLWPVRLGVTDTLMEEFYANLWTKKLSRVEALRQAQLKIMRKGAQQASQETGQPELAAQRLPPFYWAAFVLAGDWR